MIAGTAYRRVWLVRGLAVFLLVASPLICVAQQATSPPTFEHEVKPLLKKKCFECHGEKETEAELSLATLKKVVAGGESGPVVVPGKPDASLLLEVVTAGDMPPDGEPLTESELKLIRDWIKRGQFPASGDSPPSGKVISEEDRAFWSFVPPVRPPVPDCIEHEGACNPIDHFVLWKQRDTGLQLKKEAAPPHADPTTLLRHARLATDARGSGGVRQIERPASLWEARRSRARFTTLRRALGTALAGRGRLGRIEPHRGRHHATRILALPRLRHRRFQRGQAFRSIRYRASRRR